MTHATAARPDAPADPDAERAARHARLLAELAEVGMELARDLPRQAKEAEADPAETALAFSRLSRAVRLTLALEANLAEARKARERADPLGRAADPEPDEPLADRRRGVLQLVLPDMIEAEAARENVPVRTELYAEAENLIFDEIEDEDVLNRPIPELIAAICKLLGVEPDWSLWDPAEWREPQHGLTPAEIAQGRLAEKPRRRLFPPLEAEPANDADADAACDLDETADPP